MALHKFIFLFFFNRYLFRIFALSLYRSTLKFLNSLCYLLKTFFLLVDLLLYLSYWTLHFWQRFLFVFRLLIFLFQKSLQVLYLTLQKLRITFTLLKGTFKTLELFMPVLLLLTWYHLICDDLCWLSQKGLITDFQSFFRKVYFWNFPGRLSLGSFNKYQPVFLRCQLSLFYQLKLQILGKILWIFVFFAILSQQTVNLYKVEGPFVFWPSIMIIDKEFEELKGT